MVGQASTAIGAAAALVEVVDAGHARLAAALTASIVRDVLLPDGMVARLLLVDLDGQPDEATVRPSCREAADRQRGGWCCRRR